MLKMFWLIITGTLLSSCTTLPSAPPAPPTPSSSFAVSGAIAAKNQQQGWTASFYWKQTNPQDYQIAISGPLGTESMEIIQHRNEVTFRDGKRVIHTHQAEDLLAKETGIRLPVSHLYYWIKGKPAPGPVTKITHSANGEVLTLQQAGYHLEYSNYRNHYPYKIRLLGHHLVIKIVIKSWELN